MLLIASTTFCDKDVCVLCADNQMKWEYPWLSKDIQGYPLLSKDIQRISLGIQGYPWLWLPTKLAEWIGENLQDELGFPDKANPRRGWTLMDRHVAHLLMNESACKKGTNWARLRVPTSTNEQSTNKLFRRTASKQLVSQSSLQAGQP